MLALTEKLTPARCALIVVDMQNDYLDEKGVCGQASLNLTHHQEIVPVVQRVIAAAQQAGVLVIYTRNWRTEQNISQATRDRIAMRGSGLTGAAGSWGAGWYGVEPTEQDVVISKTRYDAFFGTPLDQVLRLQGVESVILAGVQTQVCVESTARSALTRDYHVIVLEDATAAIDEEMHHASLKVLEAHFGEVVSVDIVIGLWGVEVSK